MANQHLWLLNIRFRLISETKTSRDPYPKCPSEEK